MPTTHFLRCTCGSYEAGLTPSAYNVLVLDSTGFFEETQVPCYRLAWSVFTDGYFSTSRHMAGTLLLEWITGIQNAFRTHTKEVPMLFDILSPTQAGEKPYLQIDNSFWMIESLVDTVIAQPIAAETVTERQSDPDYGVVLVKGKKELFPTLDCTAPKTFYPTTQQLHSIFAGSALALVAQPIGNFFAAELQRITCLAEHAVEKNETVESYCI